MGALVQPRPGCVWFITVGTIRGWGVELIGADSNVKLARVMFLIFAALATVVFAGCGGTSQPPEEQQAQRTADSSGQKPEREDSSDRDSGDKLGHPALGSAKAPVVLIEYGDYQ